MYGHIYVYIYMCVYTYLKLRLNTNMTELAHFARSVTIGILLGLSKLFTKFYAGGEYREVAKCSEQFILTLISAKMIPYSWLTFPEVR